MDSEQLTRMNMQISGNVQRVGYRHLVQDIARKHNITGCIKNLEGYDVIVIAEGSIEELKTFKKAIKICEFPVNVECIDSTEGEYTGEYSYFEVIRGSPEDELAERFDSAIAIFSRMEKKQDTALEMHRESISLQKETIGLQKETIGLQKETIGLQNETLGLQNETLGLQRETLNEIKGTRSDLDKILNKEITEMRDELREIRSALIHAGIMNAVKS